MIISLGGKVVKSSEKNTTHYIVSNYKASLFNREIRKKEQIFAINLKWLFHSYYFLTKMNEREQDYKVD
jgi:hypothetical protein